MLHLLALKNCCDLHGHITTIFKCEMFAVKGWSVDPASLKPQTEAFKSSAKENTESKSGKKRKRGHGDGTGSAQNDDVGQLWEKHIEGKRPPKKQKKDKRKLQRANENGQQHADVKELSQAQSREKKPKMPRNDTGNGPQALEDHQKPKKSKRHKLPNDHQTEEPKTIPEAGQDSQCKASDGGKLTSMQSAMRQKLVSARFRHLNETLYTKPSGAALQLFGENPGMFDDYHAGFRQQVSVWPENPVDKFNGEIRTRGKVRAPKKDKNGQFPRKKPILSQGELLEALPRTHGTCIIADLGCGDARLAETLQKSGDSTQLNLRLHSFDLHSPSPLVTQADVSNLPLQDGSVDIAIFCLALMGTNWISFVEEAYRILHWKGELWIAEIKSRFGRISKKSKVVEHSVGNKRKQAALKAAKEAKLRAEDERNEEDVLKTEVDGVAMSKEGTDVSAFVDVLKRRGFVVKSATGNGVDLSNKMFVKMEFVKALAPTKGKCVSGDATPGQKKAQTKFIPEADDDVDTEDEAGTLKPCLYKIR